MNTGKSAALIVSGVIASGGVAGAATDTLLESVANQSDIIDFIDETDVLLLEPLGADVIFGGGDAAAGPLLAQTIYGGDPGDVTSQGRRTTIYGGGNSRAPRRRLTEPGPVVPGGSNACCTIYGGDPGDVLRPRAGQGIPAGDPLR